MVNFMYIFEILLVEFIKKIQFQKNTPYSALWLLKIIEF